MAKKLMKKCSITLVIKKIQIKTTLRLHLTPVRMAIIKNKTNADEDVEEKEPSYTVGGNVNLHNH
jgi:hypothetical protein